MKKSYSRFACFNLIGLVLSGLLFTWIARDGTLDFWLAQQFFDPVSQQFSLRNAAWLEFWGHTVLKLITVWVLIICIVLALASNWVAILRPWRRPLTLFVLMGASAAYLVQTMKGASVHSCPWDINVFGGTAQWFPLFGQISKMAGPGLCWPGGHASGGFALAAGYFALREIKPQLARWILAVSLLFGIVMSLVQMLRGAHFLSHNLWSLWLVWCACFVVDAVLRFVWRPAYPAV